MIRRHFGYPKMNRKPIANSILEPLTSLLTILDIIRIQRQYSETRNIVQLKLIIYLRTTGIHVQRIKIAHGFKIRQC